MNFKEARAVLKGISQQIDETVAFLAQHAPETGADACAELKDLQGVVDVVAPALEKYILGEMPKVNSALALGALVMKRMAELTSEVRSERFKEFQREWFNA